MVTAVGISATDTADEPLREELMSTLELSTNPDLTVGELTMLTFLNTMGIKQQQLPHVHGWLSSACS